MTRINLKTDPRVFAVLDDGCNRTCHTPAFIDHMRAVVESEEQELSPLVGEAKHFTGIGGRRATGRRSIPFGIALPDGSLVRAVLMSNELSIGTENHAAQCQSTSVFGQGHESRHMFLEGLWSVCSLV